MERGPSAQSDVAVQPMASKEVLNSPMMMEGFPIEFIEYFNIDMRSLTDVSKEQLADIYKFSSGDGKSMGDVLKEISNTERKVGQPAYGENRYSKVWHYMKLTNRINDLEKQKEAMNHG